jgi:hypothetical protein
VLNADRVFRETSFKTAASDDIDVPAFNSAYLVGREQEWQPWSVGGNKGSTRHASHQVRAMPSVRLRSAASGDIALSGV